MTQKEQVLMHLKDFGTISSMEAILRYKITRLAAVIAELKKDGHLIKGDMTASYNGKRYARYRLV